MPSGTTRTARHTRLLTATALLALAPLGHASDTKGTLSFTLENDLFGAGEDEHYTHGTSLSYVSDTYMPRWLRAGAVALPFIDEDDDIRMSWSLGQQIYTPNDIERRELIVDDRPYAGWLYASLGFLADNGHRSIRHVDNIDLIVGLVGPDSGAESAQRRVHEWTDSDEPRGWDNQLDDEVTFDVLYQRQWMLPLIEDNLDIVPRVALNLGTAMRDAGVGFTVRMGSGIGSDFGPPLIRPSASGSRYFKPNQAFYWYLFIGAHGRYVDHNLFLDGNDDGDSHSVDKEEWVGDVQAGAVMGWGNWRITVTNIIRSREFEGQDQPDEFGAIAVSYRL
jgi:hypothetical protein